MARSARSTTMPSVGGTRSEVGISAAATAIKLDRLAHKRRDKNKNSAKETVRRAQILQLTPLLSQVPLGTLRQIAAKMEEVEVQDGHFLFHEGDIGDFMYVVQSGALGVYVESRGKVKDILPGETCGELALIINEGRSASVKVHGITALLRLEIKQAQTYLNKIWGGQKELERRTKLLLRIPVFQYLPRDELHVLSTRMTRVTYAEPGMDIVTEGKIGDCMYLIERGSAMVWVQKVGRLNELKLNDYFGELAVLHHLPRTATVRTTEECVCLCLKQKDVLRLLDSDAMAPESREALQKGFDHYGHRQALRSSELVKSSILEFWELMVELSSKLVSGASSASASTGRSNASNKWEMLRRATGMGFVNREGYTQMHLRVSKVLQHNFTFDDGVDSATVDWAEDITAFSGDSKVDIWLEEVKKKLKDATFTTVHAMGWQSLFAKYDEDESGSIDLTEFKLAARNDLNMAEELFSEEHLCSLFAAMDDDGGGAVEYTEFSAWMSETDFSRPASYLSTLEKAKREELGEELWDAMAMLQIGCREHVDRIGWKALFAKYDDSYGDDADGQLDLEEFTEILRKECNISDDAVPDETLIDLFEAVDTDGAGGIDAEEFEDFICSDPLAMDMTYKVFAEAMFQLAQLWVEEEDEEQYAAFLDALFDRITKIANMDEETYELRELDEIHTFANEDGSIAVEGVKTKNPFAPDYPEHRDSDLDRQQMATTVTEGFDLSSSRADRTRGSGERNSAPGPWTEKEVSHLLQLVEEHGSGKWNEKAEQLKTGRTGAQVSTKYFAVMNEKREVERREKERHIKGLEAEGSSSVATTNKWTDEEVIRLVDLVTKMGLENWKAVAAELGTGRTGGQVQQKYYVVTNPGVEQEDPEGLDATEKKHLEDEDKELATVARKRKVTVAELKETIAPADREQIRRDLLDRRSHSMGNLREMRARASPQAIVAGLGAQQAASVVAPVPLAAVERPAESPISPRKRVSPKPVGWFQAPELGNRDKVTWKDKKSALPEKSSKVPTVAMQMRLLARVSKRGKSKREASSRPEAAASQTATNKTGLKVAVHPTPCVNWAATEGQTDTSLFFSPFATGHAGAQSARPHTTGSSLRSGQRLLPQQPHTARPVVPGGGGRLVAARRQPLADASAFLPPERRRPTPLDVLNGAGDGDSEQSSARTKLQTPPGLRGAVSIDPGDGSWRESATRDAKASAGTRTRTGTIFAVPRLSTPPLAAALPPPVWEQFNHSPIPYPPAERGTEGSDPRTPMRAPQSLGQPEEQQAVEQPAEQSADQPVKDEANGQVPPPPKTSPKRRRGRKTLVSSLRDENWDEAAAAKLLEEQLKEQQQNMPETVSAPPKMESKKKKTTTTKRKNELVKPSEYLSPGTDGYADAIHRQMENGNGWVPTVNTKLRAQPGHNHIAAAPYGQRGVKREGSHSSAVSAQSSGRSIGSPGGRVGSQQSLVSPGAVPATPVYSYILEQPTLPPTVADPKQRQLGGPRFDSKWLVKAVPVVRRNAVNMRQVGLGGNGGNLPASLGQRSLLKMGATGGMGGSRAYRARLQQSRDTVRSAASLSGFESNYSFTTDFTVAEALDEQSSTTLSQVLQASTSWSAKEKTEPRDRGQHHHTQGGGGVSIKAAGRVESQLQPTAAAVHHTRGDVSARSRVHAA